MCAEYGHEQLFRYFLTDPLADVSIRNYVDETPMHLAAREGKSNIIQLIVQSSTKLDIDTDTIVSC